MSEPGGGSDVASLTTSARRDGGDLVINGTKMWITNGLQVKVPKLTCIWMSLPGASELGNLTRGNVHLFTLSVGQATNAAEKNATVVAIPTSTE